MATAEANTDILAFTGQIIGNYLLEKYKIAVSEDGTYLGFIGG